MNSVDSRALRSEFEEVFIQPWNRKWQSKLGRNALIEINTLMDDLAGPIWAILDKGSAAYAYARQDTCFSDVQNPDQLETTLRLWHSSLVERVNEITAQTSKEQLDLDSVFEITQRVWGLAEKACEIERKRWDAADQD